MVRLLYYIILLLVSFNLLDITWLLYDIDSVKAKGIVMENYELIKICKNVTNTLVNISYLILFNITYIIKYDKNYLKNKKWDILIIIISIIIFLLCVSPYIIYLYEHYIVHGHLFRALNS